MNTTVDDKLEALQDMNAKLRELNALLEGLAQSLKGDKLKALQDMNGKMSGFNTLLVELGESLKEDAIASGLNR